jgi:hypothetical protein
VDIVSYRGTDFEDGEQDVLVEVAYIVESAVFDGVRCDRMELNLSAAIADRDTI